MAIEWTTAEAVKKVRENNGAAIVDLGKRFPLFTHFASNVNESGVDLMVLSGLTPQQWNNKLKALVEDGETVEAEPTKKPSGRGRKPAAAKATAPKKRAPKKVEPEEDFDDLEEEDDEDEEEAPAPRKRKVPAKKAPAKKRAPRKPVVVEDEEEDDDEDIDDFEDDFDDFDDDEEF